MNKLKKLKKIRLHREGTHILVLSFILLAGINALLFFLVDSKAPFSIVAFLSLCLYLSMVNFFRCPIRLFGQETER